MTTGLSDIGAYQGSLPMREPSYATLGAESRLTGSSAPKIIRRCSLEIQIEPRGVGSAGPEPLRRRIRPRVVRAPTPIVSTGVGRERRPPSLRTGAAVGEDSYRLAALSHESRNLRKSSRVSLSVASCARAAHSAAFCRQYPIFSRMVVSALEPATLDYLKSRERP